MPIIMIVLVLLFLFIPRIDPLKANIKKFEKYYYWFIIVFVLFVMSIQSQVILWNLGVKVNMNLVIAVAIGILFIFISMLLKNSRRNWFIGIRTPWTISSDRVWKKVHDIGSKLFFIDGILSFVGFFSGSISGFLF